MIIPIDLYQEKVQNFVQNNDFQHIDKDLTKKFQKSVQTTIQDSPLTIPKEHKWKYVNLNPSPLSIQGLIKIHKKDTPVRPVINWTEAPACKLAKHLSKTITTLLPLPYCYSV